MAGSGLLLVLLAFIPFLFTQNTTEKLTELYLEDKEPTVEDIRRAVRAGTLQLKLTPVFVGSAYKNKGVQHLLDGVVYYLPNPKEVTNEAHDQSKNEEKIVLESANRFSCSGSCALRLCLTRRVESAPELVFGVFQQLLQGIAVGGLGRIGGHSELASG